MIKKEMNAGTVRQRRNLIITSLVIAFLLYSGITIDKVNILGISLSITKANAVKDILWVFWAYFLWRFMQYSLNDESFRLRQNYFDAMSIVGKSLLKDYAEEKNPEFKKLNFSSNPNEIKKNDVGEWVFKVSGKHEDGREQITKANIESVFVYKLRLKAILRLVFLMPVFSDYLFPYFIAVAVLLYGLYIHFM